MAIMLQLILRQLIRINYSIEPPNIVRLRMGFLQTMDEGWGGSPKIAIEQIMAQNQSITDYDYHGKVFWVLFLQKKLTSLLVSH